jgi:two-component system, LytTR family, sensor kinase
MPDPRAADAPTLELSSTAPRTLGRGELALIAAFWVLLGAVMAGSRLFDPRGPGTQSPAAVAFAGMAMAQALLWAVLTPIVFLTVSRLDPERGASAPRVIVLVALALAAAILVHVVGNVVRFALLPDAVPGFGGRRGRGGRVARGGPWRIDRIGAVNDMIIAAGVLAAGIARDISLRYRARKEQATRLQAQLAEARLDALRRQLDPHFLFNTLNAVSALVERDPRGVRRMIARLSELLRHSMEGSDAAEVTVERELALLQLYVDIMRVRFQGRLEVTVMLAERARAALVPQLILQPLVENAIRHGVSHVEGIGHIVVEAAVEPRDGVPERLVLRVRDNGRGPAVADEGRRPALATGETPSIAFATGETPSLGGVGLRNTRARLAQLHGDAARFTLDAAPGGGAVAQVVLPFRTATDHAAGGHAT